MTDAIYKITETVRNYYHIDSNTPFTIEEVPATELIVPQRIDVLIKTYYVEARVKGYDMEYARDLYSKHISSITRFTNSENGQDDKNDINDFMSTFDELIKSFQKEGFKEDVSLIPISAEGIILDGAHRLACAVFFNKKVSVIRFPHINLNADIRPGVYDYNYFQNYLLDQKYLDVAVQYYLKYCKRNIYIACFWPASNDLKKRNAAIQYISEKYSIIAQKEVTLSFFAFDRLVAQIYMHDDWVGTIENNFSGSQGKSKLTYKDKSSSKFVLFEGIDKEDTLRVKDEIRAIFNIGKHSVHMTDNTEQTRFITNIVFNRNSILFLQYSNPGKYSQGVKNLYNLNCGRMYGVAAAITAWGLAPFDNDKPFIQQEDLQQGLSLDCISDIPDTHFYYLGMKMFMPENTIITKYLREDSYGPCVVLSQLKKHRFDKIKYKVDIVLFNIKSNVYTVVVKHPSLLSLIKKAKSFIHK